MPNFNVLDWLHADVRSNGTLATLLKSPSAPVQDYQTAFLRGTNLAITPDANPNAIPEGPALAGRVASGTVTSLVYGRGLDSQIAVYPYEITGLSVSFAELIAHGGDVLAFVLLGNDEIHGTGNVETMQGYGGNDRLAPGFANSNLGGSDLVDGGSGQDMVWFGNLNVSVTVSLAAKSAFGANLVAGKTISATLISIEDATGGSGNDVLIGDANANVLAGGAGDDEIRGGAGDDRLFGDAGNDLMYGEAGNDVIHGGDGSDQMFGDGGNDQFMFTTDFSGLARDSADGGAGSDTVNFSLLSGGVTVLLSSVAFDRIGNQVSLVSVENADGSAYDDSITGSDAANRIIANGGNDVIYGGAGADTLYGEAGNDDVNGGDGDDSVLGGLGDDLVNGNNGNDVLYGGAGADALNGGAGYDTASYVYAASGVEVNLSSGRGAFGEAAGDALFSIERAFGSEYADTLVAGESGSALYGFGGDDNVYGQAGIDAVEGGNGADVIFGASGDDRLGGGAGNDTLYGEAGADALYGGDGNDYVSSGDGNDVLFGDAGNDQMVGGAGDDFFVLGLGDDGLTLGAGRDLVRFDYGNGRDTIFDFKSGEDRLDFTHTDLTLAAVQANSIETAAGVLMTLGSGTILLYGAHLADIHWNTDMLFV